MLSKETYFRFLFGDAAYVERYLAEGGLVDERDAQGRTLLMAACRNGNIELAKLLLDLGADVNAASANGTTALMYAKTSALGSGDLSLMRCLLHAGADPGVKDAAGMTCLDYAIRNSRAVIDYLKRQETRP